MTHLLFRPAGLALVLAVLGSAASAGPIEQACNKSKRDAANRMVCNCIQQVANMTMAGSDQRRAAEFFKNPEKAQDVRLSDTNRDDAFWERYTQFGSYAEQYCASNS